MAFEISPCLCVSAVRKTEPPRRGGTEKEQRKGLCGFCASRKWVVFILRGATRCMNHSVLRMNRTTEARRTQRLHDIKNEISPCLCVSAVRKNGTAGRQRRRGLLRCLSPRLCASHSSFLSVLRGSLESRSLSGATRYMSNSVVKIESFI